MEWNGSDYFFVYNQALLFRFLSLAGSNDFWRFGLGLVTYTQYRTAFRADTKKKQQRRTEQNNIEQLHKSQGFQQEPVAGELNSPAISRELAAYVSLEITPI